MKIEIKKITGKEDLKLWVSWLNDVSSSIYSNRKFKKNTIKSQRKFINIKKKSPNAILYKIIYNNKFVGLIEIDQINLNHMHCDIGFMLDPKYHSKGIVTRALNLICKIAKKKKFRILYGRCYSKNFASINVFKKNKFKKIATLKEHYLLSKINKKFVYDNMLIFEKKLY
jgi:RimJ/RimL family protein N-acetyltransferase